MGGSFPKSLSKFALRNHLPWLQTFYWLIIRRMNKKKSQILLSFHGLSGLTYIAAHSSCAVILTRFYSTPPPAVHKNAERLRFSFEYLGPNSNFLPTGDIPGLVGDLNCQKHQAVNLVTSAGPRENVAADSKFLATGWWEVHLQFKFLTNCGAAMSPPQSQSTILQLRPAALQGCQKSACSE